MSNIAKELISNYLEYKDLSDPKILMSKKVEVFIIIDDKPCANVVVGTYRDLLVKVMSDYTHLSKSVLSNKTDDDLLQTFKNEYDNIKSAKLNILIKNFSNNRLEELEF